MFGEAGKSSIRGGYSISYTRDGFTVISNAMGVGTTNPGLIATSAVTTPTGVLTAAGIQLPTPVFGIPTTDRANNLINPNNSLWAVDPNLRTPYVQQWSFGYEREIFANTAFEVRYSANHAIKLYRAVDFNEVNIFENGFLDEFKRAQQNLAACISAGTTACRAAQTASGVAAGSLANQSFGNWGLPGQVPLTILPRFFAGTTAFQASNYANATFISHLNNNNVASIASTLAFSNTYRSNRENAANGIPANFFVANPNSLASRLLGNDSMSNYHSLQVELRRRFSGGLMFQADYTFSKAMTDAPDAAGNLSQSTLENFRTFRDKKLDYTRSRDDQTHRFVINGIYDLPFGRGRRYADNANGFVNQVIGGWTVGAIGSWQTNPPFFITSGRTSFNSTAAGTAATGLPAQLLGMTFEEFKRNVGIFRTPGGIFWFNPDLLDITHDAAGRVTQSRLKTGLIGQPEAGTFGNFPINSLHAGTFFNLDMSVTKRFPIGERVRLELKTTFINILNKPSFNFGTTQFDSTSFGRITGTRSGVRVIHFMGSMRF